MKGITLQDQDLSRLCCHSKDLNFEDSERRSALLESGSRDFNAVPGSGKTSLLAAKLMLLATKWPHSRRGICVLSHTNVARHEIIRRLETTNEGCQLLSYPHFIGTIHGFVNQFFATPMLRSMDQRVDFIDDEAFSTLARSRLKRAEYGGLRFFLSRQRNGDDIVSTLFYKTADFTLRSENGSLPGSHTESFRLLQKIKSEITRLGVFRHRDIFAYANLALRRCSHLADVVKLRFPLVFIDEMQDTSWEQEEILNRIFDGKTVMQRFGDMDQKILSDEEDSDKLTFPRKGYGIISTSKRFGTTIANAVSCVRMSGDPVVGEGSDSHQLILLLYNSETVMKVVEHFGRIVLERLSETDLNFHDAKAMCARKAGTGNVETGRHMLDYWPNYSLETSSQGEYSENFWKLITPVNPKSQDENLSDRVSDVRRALLLLLRNARAPIARDIRDYRSLPRIFRESYPLVRIDELTHKLMFFEQQVFSNDIRTELLQNIYDALKPCLPESLAFQDFKALKAFEDTGVLVFSTHTNSNTCGVLHNGRSIQLGLGTVAGIKGETHSASLVLESYGGTSRKFDVALGLEYVAEIASKPLKKLKKTQQAQIRNLYVAMSRPTKLLCLAANECRISQDLRDALIKKGWSIEVVS